MRLTFNPGVIDYRKGIEIVDFPLVYAPLAPNWNSSLGSLLYGGDSVNLFTSGYELTNKYDELGWKLDT